MLDMDSGLWPTFTAAIQAAVSVLFTILWGVLAGHLEILDEHSTKKLSHLCVTMLLPALLVTSIGSELNPDNVVRYTVILGWSLSYTLSTLIVSLYLKRIFRLPPWTVVAMTFNSNTSMPLLLTQALASSGIIDGLLASESDTVPSAVSRARSYFLANALCANVLMFAVGPSVLRENDSHPRIEHETSDTTDVEPAQDNSDDTSSSHMEGMSLLRGPQSILESGARHRPGATNRKRFGWLPSWVQRIGLVIYSSSNPVLAGGLIAAVVGLVPTLHRAFFNKYQSGGMFNAWFVTSIETVGNIFVGLQILIVGEGLSRGLKQMAQGEDIAKLPWTGVLITLMIRYVVWPVISLASIYLIAAHTSLISGDPLLPFAMMLMPCGPSAIKLAVLANVSASTPGERLKLAKFLSISYALSPMLAFAVTGSFKASKAIHGQ